MKQTNNMKIKRNSSSDTNKSGGFFIAKWTILSSLILSGGIHFIISNFAIISYVP